MAFIEVRFSNFRNLGECRLVFDAATDGRSLEGRNPTRLVVLHGANASGKSSFVEGLSVLSTGKSFRTNDLDKVIKNTESELSVFSRVRSSIPAPSSELRIAESDVEHVIGVRKRKGQSIEVRKDKATLTKTSELAKVSPVLLITPENLDLISGPPSVRRQFFDFTMFHVKHEYIEVYRQWKEIQRQRNSWLKRQSHSPPKCLDSLEFKVWDEPYRQLSVQLSLWRKEKLIEINHQLSEAVGDAGLVEIGGALKELNLSFRHAGQQSTEVNFKSIREKELRYGYSLFGPHSEKIDILTDGKLARDKLSRGQQKRVIILLKLLQLKEIARSASKSVTVVVDDFGSELDELSQNELLHQLLTEANQVIITVLDKSWATLPVVQQSIISPSGIKVFHVKHGEFFEQTITNTAATEQK